MKVPRLNPFLLLLLLGIGGWLLFGDTSSLVVNRRVEVRAVTPTGEIWRPMSKNTIDIFRNAAPSVVYIDSIALRRGFFSLNAVEIPQGTGSGFAGIPMAGSLPTIMLSPMPTGSSRHG